MINRRDRAEPHRHRGKLPEIRHQPRMRVGRQANSARNFAAEMDELIFGQATFQVGSRVDSRRGVPLEVNHVAGVVVGPGVEKVVEASLVKRCCRGVRRDVAADSVEVAIGPHDHRHSVPANDAFDPSLDIAIAGKDRLIFGRDRVDVRRIRAERHVHAALEGSLLEEGEHRLDFVRSVSEQQIVQ